MEYLGINLQNMQDPYAKKLQNTNWKKTKKT